MVYKDVIVKLRENKCWVDENIRKLLQCLWIGLYKILRNCKKIGESYRVKKLEMYW